MITEAETGTVISSGHSSITENVVSVSSEEWGATDLLAYIRERICHFHGPQPQSRRDLITIQGFVERHGITDAVRIARAAFDVHEGMWLGAPVSPGRFAASSDDCFARRILSALAPA